MKKKKFYCSICKKNTKNSKSGRCPICLGFKGRKDYENFLLGKSSTGESYPH